MATQKEKITNHPESLETLNGISVIEVRVSEGILGSGRFCVLAVCCDEEEESEVWINGGFATQMDACTYADRCSKGYAEASGAAAPPVKIVKHTAPARELSWLSEDDLSKALEAHLLRSAYHSDRFACRQKDRTRRGRRRMRRSARRA